MTANFSDKDLRAISELQYKKSFKPGQEIGFENINGEWERIGYLYQTIDNRDTGLYTYIVTDRPVSSEADFEQVKSVHVFYRGSEGFLSYITDNDAFKKDWFENDFPTALQILNKVKEEYTPQLIDASNVLNESMKQFPNAYFDLDGHSLGGMDGQFAVSEVEEPERIRSAVFMNAPGLGPILTPEKMKWAKQVKNRTVQFYDRYDIVQKFGNVELYGLDSHYSDLKALAMNPRASGYIRNRFMEEKWEKYTRPMDTVGRLVMIDAKRVDFVSQHIYGGQQYDSYGRLLLSNTIQNDDLILKEWRKSVELYDQLYAKGVIKKIAQIRREYQAYSEKSPGGAKIYLDLGVASVLIDGVRALLSDNVQRIHLDLDRMLAQAEEIWAETQAQLVQFAPTLGIMEANAHLSGCGSSYSSVVGPIQEFVDKQKQVLLSLEIEYMELLTSIKNNATELWQTDSNNAAKIKF